MSTALMLVWIFSLSLSGSQVASDKPRFLIPNKVWVKVVKKSVSVATDTEVHKTSEKPTTMTPSLVEFTKGTLAANFISTKVPAETTHRTNVSTSAATKGVTASVTSGAATPPLSPVPTSPTTISGRQTPTTTVPGLPSVSTPHTQVPRTSTPPGTVARVTALTTSNQTAAIATTNTNSPSSTLSSSEHTPTNSTASTAPTVGPQAQGPPSQMSPAQPVLSTANGSLSLPSNITLVATAAPSMTSASSTAVATIQTQAKEPTTSSVPMPPTILTPKVETTLPTMLPSSVSSTHGAGESATSQISKQVETKATTGTASAGVTPGSSRDPKMSATDLCQSSTEDQYLVVTTEPLTPSSVNKTFLLAVLILGVTLFVTVVVLFALQAFESYKKKDYTQVDYLINGMYADSEM